MLERSDDRIVTLKQVSNAEEYLLDHFAGFPVLPGVFMIEALVQAARTLLETRKAGTGAEANAESPAPTRMVLGGVRGIKYGSFVRPGDGLRICVSVHKRLEDGAVEFKGEGSVIPPNSVGSGDASNGERTAVSGRFVLRPLKLV